SWTLAKALLRHSSASRRSGRMGRLVTGVPACRNFFGYGASVCHNGGYTSSRHGVAQTHLGVCFLGGWDGSLLLSRSRDRGCALRKYWSRCVAYVDDNRLPF